MTEKATFAAGCFWSVELAFQRLNGVTSTRVGYTGGTRPNPTYREVCAGDTGHAEAVELEYDPAGNDVGTQYRSAIFYHSDAQRDAALASREQEQTKYKDPIVTEIVPATQFWPAEDNHQRYLEKQGGQCAAKGCCDAIRCYG
ncbi:peptide methionine sulfoxide reductase MsrA [Syncephalis pseudoplumigaleata]|uniref:peptide-methionine (S)-S-oxide reductase n=1 Tax=Syncephalis pseudoplumigaleata TaxID=1712513 RepID=A0A4P9YVV0_9FUNG|nr:peptide methionine sulfoxide reductase MsrA [Syncephalis pseudoplumigaleata]|eukprot:RKP23958.1 peptide methionine sulfoxide reductase MsrA [Syncephalis pseudoplumigaleata]